MAPRCGPITRGTRPRQARIAGRRRLAAAARPRRPRGARRPAAGKPRAPPRRASTASACGERARRRPRSAPTRSPRGRRRRRPTPPACSVRPRARRRQPAALDGRQMLAHGVQLVDVGARLQQPPHRLLLVVERDARRPAAPSAPSRRPTAAPAADRRARTRRRRRARGARPRRCRRSAADGPPSMPLRAGRRRRRARRARCRASVRGATRRTPRASASSIAAAALPAAITSHGRGRRQRCAQRRASTSARGTSSAGIHGRRGPRATMTVEIVARRRASRSRSVDLPGVGPAGSPVTTSNCRSRRLTTWSASSVGAQAIELLP